MIDEKKLDHWWETQGKPSLIEWFNQETVSKQSTSTGTQPSSFNLEAINWKVGSGPARRDAGPDEPFSYAFVEDMQGQVYPEVKPLWDAVCRYGTINVDGWEIIQFGDRAKMIAKRRPKEN